jgi:hypothetical protein
MREPFSRCLDSVVCGFGPSLSTSLRCGATTTGFYNVTRMPLYHDEVVPPV